METKRNFAWPPRDICSGASRSLGEAVSARRPGIAQTMQAGVPVDSREALAAL
jgi:hypothetical protein